ncbi:cell wall-binding repeat-containing protein [Arthrobacter sp. lap29]|uniref:cell wall-binding repeat-containing protein n=1 Tax=Arthrobacter sp. lap29 TaxID=3056122 RepID=UPI0028F7000D|nr:cell wall-binding repeat-containing protein [Arthrobacter sp. lap29]
MTTLFKKKLAAIAAALTLGGAGTTQATVNCGPGYVPDVGGNGSEICFPAGTGGVPGGGRDSTEGDCQGRGISGNAGGVNSDNNPPSLLPVVLSPASNGKAVDRLAAPGRYTTAVNGSRSGYPCPDRVVYLATGTNCPDAPVAAMEVGPLLLTPPGVLPAATGDKIERLNPAKFAVGGTYAASNTVFTAIRQIVPNTVSCSGTNRCATSRAVVTRAFSATACIATGVDYPDALSAFGPRRCPGRARLQFS